ncbi:MAG TPA: protein kinase [Polyangiaceae bacterium]
MTGALPRVGRYDILLELQDEGFVSLMVAKVRGPNAGPPIVELARVERTLAREIEVKAAFLAEARAAGRVRHANLIHPTDTLVVEGDLYGATEFTLGVRFDELLRAASAANYEIPLPVTLRIILDVIAGLSALHASGANAAGSRPIVHGDVTPTNITIGYRGDVRLIHSGLSSVTSRVGAIGQRNRRLAYKAPEQLRSGVNAVPIGPTTDVFAIGVLLWEALRGRRLFDADSDVAVVERILNEPVPPLETGGDRHIPIALLALVNMALEKAPAHRFANAALLGDAIQRAPGVRLATNEELGAVVDELVGPMIERRREEIEKAIAQAARAPSEGSLRVAGAASQLRQLAAMKTPVGLVFPPPSSAPTSPRGRGSPLSDRFPESLPPATPRLARSEPRMLAPLPVTVSPAQNRRLSGRTPPRAPSQPRIDVSEQNPVGWVYYVAFGAILGTLVFVLVSGPARRSTAAPSPPEVSLGSGGTAAPTPGPSALPAEPTVVKQDPAAEAPEPAMTAPHPLVAEPDFPVSSAIGGAPTAHRPKSPAAAPKPSKPAPVKAVDSDIPPAI